MNEVDIWREKDQNPLFEAKKAHKVTRVNPAMAIYKVRRFE